MKSNVYKPLPTIKYDPPTQAGTLNLNVKSPHPHSTINKPLRTRPPHHIHSIRRRWCSDEICNSFIAEDISSMLGGGKWENGTGRWMKPLQPALKRWAGIMRRVWIMVKACCEEEIKMLFCKDILCYSLEIWLTFIGRISGDVNCLRCKSCK